MPESQIIYFESPGKQNTDQVVEAVVRRVQRGGIGHVVVASGSGDTGLKLISRLQGMSARVVVVSECCGSDKEGVCEMGPDAEKRIVASGARLVRATHALSGIERSVSKKLGGASRVEAIAETLRALFGHGMKVCVEIAVMAADNGAIPCGEVEVIAVGGSSYGADTACVVRPAHANAFFNFEVREILAIPRNKRS